MNEPLVSVDEVIREADERLGKQVGDVGEIREWYDQLLAERTAKHNVITIADGSKIEVGKVYDLRVKTYGRGNEPEQTLHGYVIDYRGATWNDRVIMTHKQGPQGREWQGRRRELHPDRILSAVEVTR